MTKGKQADSKPSPEEAVKKAVADTPGGTTEGIAKIAGIARSSAGKALSRLANTGELTRHEGGREKGKCLPDRWTLSGVKMPAAYAAHVKSTAGSRNKSSPAPTSKRSGAAGVKRPKSSTGAKPAAAKPTRKHPAAKEADGAGDRRQPAGKPDRLQAFGLDPLVLAYVAEHTDSAPHGPAAVAKAINRSSGAVANCMKRLAEKKQLRQVSDKPVRYDKTAA